MIFLEHPVHGTHIAYTNQEVEQCEKNGWKRRDAPKLPKKAKEEVENVTTAPDERAVLVEAYRQKHGKRPHHKLSVASLKAALA